MVERLFKDDEEPSDEDPLKVLFFFEGETEEAYIPAEDADALDKEETKAYLETVKATEEQHTDYQLKNEEHVFLYPCEFVSEDAPEAAEEPAEAEILVVQDNTTETIEAAEDSAEIVVVQDNATEIAEAAEDPAEIVVVQDNATETAEAGEIVEAEAVEATEEFEVDSKAYAAPEIKITQPADKTVKMTFSASSKAPYYVVYEVLYEKSGTKLVKRGSTTSSEITLTGVKNGEHDYRVYPCTSSTGPSSTSSSYTYTYIYVNAQSWRKAPSSVTVKQDKVRDGNFTFTFPGCTSPSVWCPKITVKDSTGRILSVTNFEGRSYNFSDKSVTDEILDDNGISVQKKGYSWLVSINAPEVFADYNGQTLYAEVCYIGSPDYYTPSSADYTLEQGKSTTKSFKVASPWANAPKILTLTQSSAVAPEVHLSWSFTGSPKGFKIFDNGIEKVDVDNGRNSEEDFSSTESCELILSGTGKHSIQVVPYRYSYGKSVTKAVTVKIDWMNKALAVSAAQPTQGTVVLSWKPFNGVDGYYIYEYSGKNVIKSYRTSDSSYTITGVSNGTHKYAVQPYYNSTYGKISAQKSVTVGTKTTPVKYRALVIGNTYSGNNNVSQLPGCGNDATTMSGMLKSMSATPYTVTVKKNQTAGQIISDIASAFSAATEADVSLFHFSGHGCSTGNLYCNDGSELSVWELRQALDQIPGKKIVLLDCCYSGMSINKDGTVTEKEVTDADIEAFADAAIAAFYEATPKAGELASGNYYVMTACSKEQTSLEISAWGKRVGLFTYTLEYVSGWNEPTNKKLSYIAADADYGNGDNKVSLNEAYNAVTDYIGSGSQTTRVYPEGSGFVLYGRK